MQDYDFNTELIVTYATLDQLIEKSKITGKQKFVVDKLIEGYTEDDIAKELNQTVVNINLLFTIACLNIKESNDDSWLYDNIYLNYKKVIFNYKKCTKCKKYKPAIKEFFSPDTRNKDGLYGKCRNCRGNTSKTLIIKGF